MKVKCYCGQVLDAGETLPTTITCPSCQRSYSLFRDPEGKLKARPAEAPAGPAAAPPPLLPAAPPGPPGLTFAAPTTGRPLPKTSGLAIASLVLGIVGVLLFPLAIVGLILGIVGLNRIRRSEGRLGGGGLAIGGICVSSAALVFIWGLLLLPALVRAREEARKAQSRTNLKQIGMAMHMYRVDFDDRFPTSLEVLHPGYLGEKGVLFSYEYQGHIPRNAPSNLIVCYSRKGIYPEGRNVLFRDGVVTWVTEATLHGPGGPRGLSLPQCYQTVLDLSGGRLTEEQQARLKKFYEVGQ